jgi:tetratricopeptide (TPR) repeat protein
MAIRGSLREASLPDVLQLLAMGKKTGCLSVTHRNNFGYIYFDRGRIAYASIVNRRDRLGDLLVKAGLLTRVQLDGAITVQAADPNRRLGDILVSQRLVSREALHEQVRTQIEEAVYYLFTWSQGTFNFEPDIRPEEQDYLAAINPESLLLEGAHRVDEWSLIERKVPSFDIVFDVDREHVQQSGVTFTPIQDTVLALLDGRRDVRTIVDESGLGEFEVGKALYGLASASFVHRVGRTKTADPAVSDARVEEHRNLGIAFYKTGMFEEATREFRRVSELRPADHGAPFYLGLVLIRQGKWPAAVAAYEEASAMPGARPAVFHNLAYALERLGRYEEAQAALEQATTRGGRDDARVRMSLGVLALRRGAVADADALLTAARSLWGVRPPAPAWFHYAGLAAAMRGELERAIALLREGVGYHPHAAPLYNNLATILERRGSYADAALAAERGLQEAPGLAQLHKNAGDYAYRTARYDDAFEAYQRAARANPELGEDLYFKMGNIQYRRGDATGAMQSWERALELDPDSAIVRSNLETVRRTTRARA